MMDVCVTVEVVALVGSVIYVVVLYWDWVRKEKRVKRFYLLDTAVTISCTNEFGRFVSQVIKHFSHPLFHYH